jgi:hypothetical protein
MFPAVCLVGPVALNEQSSRGACNLPGCLWWSGIKFALATHTIAGDKLRTVVSKRGFEKVNLSRRHFLTSTAALACGVGALSLTGCDSAEESIGGAGLSVVALAVPGPGWVADLALAVGANLISNAVLKGVSLAWKSWNHSIRYNIDVQSEQGWQWVEQQGWGHPVPPTALIGTCRQEAGITSTDRLVMCSHAGPSVTLESWGWQALHGVIATATAGSTGLGEQRLRSFVARCVLANQGRLSSGHSPDGTSAWLEYPTHEGSVEMSLLNPATGKQTVLVTVRNMPSFNSPDSQFQFALGTRSQIL